jgi:hypothetical protein
MSLQNTNRTLFKPTTESVLVRGLNAMTIACDSLTRENESLNAELVTLKLEVDRLTKRLITDSIEKE